MMKRWKSRPISIKMPIKPASEKIQLYEITQFVRNLLPFETEMSFV